MPSSPLPSWWFILGRESLISAAELAAVLHLSPQTWGTEWRSVYQDDSNLSLLRVQVELDPVEIMKCLGGTVKIAQEVAGALTEPELLDTIEKELKTVEGKINFGISVYSKEQGTYLPDRQARNKEQIERWGKDIKRRLKEQGRSVRYVFKNEQTLSSVTVAKNGLDKRGRELIIAPSPLRREAGGEVSFALAKTAAVQPFEAFSARDYGRPGRDDKSGMLPPKLAMMMINLVGNSKSQVANSKLSILDPFCGSGTILTEAMLLGYTNIVGADISAKAVEYTKKNIAWTQNQLQPTTYNLQPKIFQSDVLRLTDHLSSASMDVIVSEPYLGPPLKGSEFPEHVEQTAADLASLYTQTFSEFRKILKPNGVIIFIIPRFKTKNTWVRVSDQVIPEIKKLGFVPERMLPTSIQSDYHLFYHRPGQFVGREIWKLIIH